MRTNYTKEAFARNGVYKGKSTSTETKTEQEYLPVVVQVKRFFNAGEILQNQKKSLYQLGWDEEFNMNTIKPDPITENLSQVELQERLEELNERIEAQKQAAIAERELGTTEPELEENSTEDTTSVSSEEK